MTLTKRRPAAMAPHSRSRTRQRILPGRPLRLQRARSFAWAVAGDAMDAIGALGTKQQQQQQQPGSSMVPPVGRCSLSSSSSSSSSSIRLTGRRRLPSVDLLFRHVERVSLRKLSRTTQSILLATDTAGATLTATPNATNGMQTPSSSALAMRHGQRRWCLVRQCLVKARAHALSREMQHSELDDLARLGAINGESDVLDATKKMAITTTRDKKPSEHRYQEEDNATTDSWWGPAFPEEREALQLWWATAHEMELREACRQTRHPVPIMAAGSPRSSAACCMDAPAMGCANHIIKPPSPPQSPPAITPH